LFPILRLNLFCNLIIIIGAYELKKVVLGAEKNKNS
jgi:hypothetical protein